MKNLARLPGALGDEVQRCFGVRAADLHAFPSCFAGLEAHGEAVGTWFGEGGGGAHCEEDFVN